MGDYTKLIVSCQVDVPEEDLRQRVSELSLNTSAYHSQEYIVSIERSDWSHREGDCTFNLILVGQTKWGRGQEDFLNWLKPYVTDASGPLGIWAFQISEYGEDGLVVHKLQTNEV